MDGIHDMGGTQGWGTVAIPSDEPVFAEPWEAKAFAFGAFIDSWRHIHLARALTDRFDYGHEIFSNPRTAATLKLISPRVSS